MRWRRSCKRLMILLMFICMTVKLHLEFRLLDATKSDNSFSPWWSNETLGHLRAFRKEKVVPKGNGLSKSTSLDFIRIGNESVRVLGVGKDVLPDASLPLGGSSKPLNSHRESSLLKLSNKTVSVLIKETTQNNVTNSDGVLKKNVTENIQKQNPDNDKSLHSTQNQLYGNRKLSNEREETKPLAETNRTSTNTKTQTIKSSSQNLVEGKALEPQVPKPKEETRLKVTPIGIPKDVPRFIHKDVSKVIPKAVAKIIAKTKSKQGIRPAVRTNAKKGNPVKRGVSHDVDSQEVSLTPNEIEDIKKKLEKLNEEQKIHNEDTYGPFLGSTNILLVQVHNRLENLRFLVESMRHTKGINETLVVFSHDYWYPAMNDFVASIKDFRVMQMFFPFSIQLHPHKFPGRDPRDCSWNDKKLSGLDCLNRDWPDSYGHYREASFTQIKHHWWWKINRVFSGLRITQNNNYTGHVVFLEEDHYILPDLLHILSVMQRERKIHCATCQVLALGNYNKMSPNVYKNFIERGDWWVTKHNLGFALDKTAWTALTKCRTQFCMFDDYNWDWTLNNLIQTCFKPRMAMLSVKFSRVIHVGSCGTHVKKKSCDVTKEVQVAKNRIAAGKQWLFPKVLAYQNVYRGSGRVKKGNGGWGDLRDRQLCQAIWNGTASEDVLIRLEMVHTP